MISLDPDFSHNHLKFCAAGPLVYARTLKCASSFFYNNLTENFKWEPITWNQINWNYHHVFGHMLDPIERRHKGILEHIIATNNTDLLESSENFRKLIKDITRLDEHTISYWDNYGRYCYFIDWIPLNLPNNQVIEQTQKLMGEYGQKDFHWDYRHSRPASPDMKKWVKILRDIWPDRDRLPLATRTLLNKDLILYNEVTEKFNAAGRSWATTSWLR